MFVYDHAPSIVDTLTQSIKYNTYVLHCDQRLYPKMADNQLALVLPGAFASHTNPDCAAECYDDFASQDAWDYYAWMQDVSYYPWR